MRFFGPCFPRLRRGRGPLPGGLARIKRLSGLSAGSRLSIIRSMPLATSRSQRAGLRLFGPTLPSPPAWARSPAGRISPDQATVRPFCRIASVDHQIDALSNFPVPKGRVASLWAALPAPPAWARTSAGRISPDKVKPDKVSGRRRDYSRRPPTPPYVRFRIRRFMMCG